MKMETWPDNVQNSPNIKQEIEIWDEPILDIKSELESDDSASTDGADDGNIEQESTDIEPELDDIKQELVIKQKPIDTQGAFMPANFSYSEHNLTKSNINIHTGEKPSEQYNITKKPASSIGFNSASIEQENDYKVLENIKEELIDIDEEPLLDFSSTMEFDLTSIKQEIKDEYYEEVLENIKHKSINIKEEPLSIDEQNVLHVMEKPSISIKLEAGKYQEILTNIKQEPSDVDEPMPIDKDKRTCDNKTHHDGSCKNICIDEKLSRPIKNESVETNFNLTFNKLDLKQEQQEVLANIKQEPPDVDETMDTEEEEFLLTDFMENSCNSNENQSQNVPSCMNPHTPVEKPCDYILYSSKEMNKENYSTIVAMESDLTSTKEVPKQKNEVENSAQATNKNNEATPTESLSGSAAQGINHNASNNLTADSPFGCFSCFVYIEQAMAAQTVSFWGWPEWLQIAATQFRPKNYPPTRRFRYRFKNIKRQSKLWISIGHVT